jgi:hypothetical protein
MKRLLLLSLLVLTAATAGATTLAEFCGALRYREDIQRCLTAASGRYVDEDALSACSALRYTDDRVACVANIAGKEYSPEDVALCTRLRYTDDIQSCLAVSGRRVSGGGGGGPEGGRCRERGSQALRECRRVSSDPAAVLLCLQNALELDPR